MFRLRDTAAIPVLFDHPRGGLLVATTKLSHFVTGRYMPAECWGVIWRTILGRVGLQVGALQWTPTVRPTYGRDESLAADAESRALARSADWIIRSRVLRHPQWPAPALKWSLTYNTLRDMPRAEWSAGDGSFGVLEGFSSSIRMDGSQPMRYAVRNDCMTEVAMLMALEAATVGRPQHAKVAREMLDYDLLRSLPGAGGFGQFSRSRLGRNYPAKHPPAPTGRGTVTTFRFVGPERHPGVFPGHSAFPLVANPGQLSCPLFDRRRNPGFVLPGLHGYAR